MWLEGVTLDIHTTVQAKNAAKLEVLPETLGTRSASLRASQSRPFAFGHDSGLDYKACLQRLCAACTHVGSRLIKFDLWAEACSCSPKVRFPAAYLVRPLRCLLARLACGRLWTYVGLP